MNSGLSDHDSDEDIVPGEDQVDSAEQISILKHIDESKYARRYADYSEEANEKQFDMLRKSTEMLNRRSITSSLAFRRRTVSS